MDDLALRLNNFMHASFPGDKKRVFSMDDFDDPKAEAEILSLMPDMDDFRNKRKIAVKMRDGVDAELKFLYMEPLLSKKQEYHLFRKYNFIKYKFLKLRYTKRNSQKIRQYLDMATETKQQLIYSNTRLIMNLAKNQKEYITNNRNHDLLLELIADGNIGLIRAIDYFDYRKGFKFSTYASWCIVRTMGKAKDARQNISSKFLTGQQLVLDKTIDEKLDHPQNIEEKSKVNRIIDILPTDRHKKIIQACFGIKGDKLTMAELGKDLKISRERVRQIKQNGLEFIRKQIVDAEN